MKVVSESDHVKINSNTCGQLIELINNENVPISITKAKNLLPTTKHAHKKSTEVYWVTNGSITLKVDQKEITLNKGDIVVLEPGEFHKVTKASDENTVIVLSNPPWSPNDEVAD